MQISWHLNRIVCRNLWLLNLAGARLTITNLFRSPGDTLLTAMVCRIVKGRYPRIRINCCVNHPELVENDPALSTINAPAGRWQTEFEYLELLERKDGETQVLAPMMRKLGIRDYDYRARVYLTTEEIAKARALLGEIDRPLVTISVMSREAVKIWPLAYWQTVVRTLARDFTLVQLGDASEPLFEEAISFAGKLSLRESMAVLSQAHAHIGPDSFLMHAAKGLDVRSVIIFGGSRTPATLGYAGNENLYRATDCSPCWIHTTKGERCTQELKCMHAITPEDVLRAVRTILARPR